MVFFIYLFVFLTGIFGLNGLLKRHKVRNLYSSYLSEHERAIVAAQVPITQKLPADLSEKHEGKIRVFLHQVEFIGCDGLQVTEEMRLSIAAQACLLVVNKETWYRNLRTILIYPGAFKSRKRQQDGYIVTERETVSSGESWSRGPVILSWLHAKQGALDFKDGRNVVLHEFAHQLDDLSGRTDGAPILSDGQSFAKWERVILTAYKRHLQKISRGEETVIDAYGAQGHEEFFAVSVEVFFEKPSVLIRQEPDLYAQLSELFRLEPATWAD